ncbi:PREDICTED: serine/threonine-protein phosphatase 6 regulatory ankyrin repeat subunit A-like, partial [Ceratosolen solmsi marchali]|uniref:Serine/threonine-protein phosphatase 6 regulatory ankyrin repeat subunit A-like n=1 Tax=Ceratosolen solmsi marchali TaxID=326594 RepID=A0AAJ7DTG0_9HYME
MDQEDHRIDPKAIPLLFSLSKIDINQKTKDGETMLHIAIKMSDIEVANVLLNAGANINIKDNEGNTPLSSALDSRSVEMVDLLLKYSPDFDLDIIRDKFYTSLLSFSIEDEIIVKSMVNHGFRVKKTDITNTTMLWISLLHGLEETTIDLVRYHKIFLINVKIWYRSFLLHKQPFTKKQAEMIRIIKQIMDLFIESEETDISVNHNFNLFNLLLSEHDMELMNINVISMGESFDNNEESDIVALTTDVLLACYDGEDPVCDDKGRTGLHYAAKVGNVAVIQALLDLHLDINAVDNNGKTPLNYIYDRINEFSDFDNNDEVFNNEKYCDVDFNCWFTLLDLKIGAVLLLKHASKLITANYYITKENLEIFQSLLIILSSDTVTAQYYLSIYIFIERCENEIKQMMNEKLVDISYYDFLTKNYNQITLYTKRRGVIEALSTSNDVLKKFKIYGPMLQYRFYKSYIRRGLVENAEIILFGIMKWLQLSLVVVREILSNLNNDELMLIVL